MIGWITRFMMFLSAYTPLYLAVGVLAADRFGWRAWLPCVLGILGLLGLWIVHARTKSQEPDDLVVADVTARDGDLVPYLIGYVVPFIDVDFSDNARLIAMAIIFGAIGFTQVAADLIHLNPTLLVFRRHIFEVEDTDGVRHTVITKDKRIKRGSKLKVVSLTDNYLHWTVKQ